MGFCLWCDRIRGGVYHLQSRYRRILYVPSSPAPTRCHRQRLIVGTDFDSFLVGFSLMAFGSPAMFLAQFHRQSRVPHHSRNHRLDRDLLTMNVVSNAFPTNSGLVLGAITGAFDASSLPLVFFKIAYFGHDGHPSM